MRTTIPFIAQTDPDNERRWLEALSNAMPDESILPLAKLTQAERQLADIAIVANPNPEALRQLPGLVWVQSVWAGDTHGNKAVNWLNQQRTV